MSLITVPEMAEFLRLPVSRVYTLSKEGILPSCKVGRQIRFSRKAIEDFVASGGKDYC